jgi:hypothetical protein
LDWSGVLKPRFLGFLAFVASLAFGYWLITEPHSSRELYLCLAAWLLGFWVATGIRRSQDSGTPDDADDPDDWEEDDEDP